MRCECAREIIQTLMDGEECLRAEKAIRHLAECADCREWKSDTEAAVAMLGRANIEALDIDISSSVMAQLPQKHPASVPRDVGDTTWTPAARLLGLIAACWMFGFIIIVGSIAVWLFATSTSIASLPALAYDSSRNCINYVASIAKAIWAVLLSIKPTIRELASEISTYSTSIRLFAMLSLCADTVLIFFGYILWRWRRLPTGPVRLIL